MTLGTSVVATPAKPRPKVGAGGPASVSGLRRCPDWRGPASSAYAARLLLRTRVSALPPRRQFDNYGNYIGSARVCEGY